MDCSLQHSVNPLCPRCPDIPNFWWKGEGKGAREGVGGRGKEIRKGEGRGALPDIT